MRKFILTLALLMVVIWPTTAQAQAEIVLQQMTVQLWPEYDQPAVLAIIDFSLPANTVFPVQVSLRIPANATLTAVAKDENGLITVPHEEAEAADNWRAISLSVDGPETYRLEYYYPFAQAGNTRSFSFVWSGDYAVQTMQFHLQEPTEIKNLSTNPAMSDPFPNESGMLLHELNVNDLAAGKTYQVDVQYDRATDEMSAASLSVEPSGGSITPTQTNSSLTNILPYALGALGVLLIVGSGMWYWQSGRGTSENIRQRKRHAARASTANDEDDAESTATYCHQCGRRAGPSDKFCRACGTRLRVE